MLVGQNVVRRVAFGDGGSIRTIGGVTTVTSAQNGLLPAGFSKVVSLLIRRSGADLLVTDSVCLLWFPRFTFSTMSLS